MGAASLGRSIAWEPRERDEDPAVTRLDELAAAAPWARRTATGWMLTIRVQPGARRSELAGPYGEALRVRIAAPAVDGQANDELVRFLANEFGVHRRAIRIVRGETNRSKLIEVTTDD